MNKWIPWNLIRPNPWKIHITQAKYRYEYQGKFMEAGTYVCKIVKSLVSFVTFQSDSGSTIGDEVS